MNLKSLLCEVIAIVQDAGTQVMCIYKEKKPDVFLKGDHSPITKADLLSDTILKSGLKKLLDCPCLSEENIQAPYQVRKNWDLFWMVDPLDGTKEFISQTGEFTINVALMQKSKPILGVVYAPAIQQMYYAADGVGAFKKKSGQSPSRLSSKEKIHQSLRVVVSRSHLDEDTKSFISKLGKNSQEGVETVSLGSSLKCCMVASEEADIYPRFATTMEWDIAAAQAIVMLSGAVLYDIQTQEPLIYNKSNLKNNGFVVCTKAMLPRVHELLF